MPADMSDVLLSIVIPVFNKAACLESCINRLARQDDISFCEVVFVDDGSTDDSLSICEELSRTTSFVRTISQSNGGVSSARNAGIAAAHGGFVLFLDADDELAAGSIKALIAAIDDMQGEVDLITYAIRYVNANSGQSSRHIRAKLLKESGIYDLAEMPSIAQTTINVCVSRDAALRHPFSEDLSLGEDQLFNTHVLSEKGKIGYCAEAEYVYYKGGGGSSAQRYKPLYAFDQMMMLYEGLLDAAKGKPDFMPYCCEMVLSNFGWRFKGGTLFPDFGTEAQRRANAERFASIAQAIPLKSYIESEYLTQFQKAFFITRFNKLPDDARVVYLEDASEVYVGDELVWRPVAPFVRMRRCEFDGTAMKFLFTLECPTFVFDARTPELAIVHHGCEHPVSLVPSSFEYMQAPQKTTRAWRFEVPVNVDEDPVDVSFALTIGDEHVFPLVIKMQIARTNSRRGRKRNVRHFPGCTMWLSSKTTLFLKLSKEVGELHQIVRDYRVDKSYAKLRTKARWYQKKHAGQSVWLYSDLPTSAMDNNAMLQLLHDVRMQDGIVRFYVTACVDEVLADHPELEGHVVEYKSGEHIILYLAADMIVASYLDTVTFMPCNARTFDKVADLCMAKKMVYVQHGILHAHIPWYFSYDRKVFDYEVVSTQFEVENLVSNYYFDRSRLITSGAPRLDQIERSVTPGRKIVYAPSWRSYLVGGVALRRKAVDDKFLNSDFYKGMVEFIECVAASGMLERYGYTFELKLHPNMLMYEEHLPLGNDRIVQAPITLREGDYAVMITDYSSYVYDFVYAGSQILYYVPDLYEFEGGANHYSKLDLPYEQGFGPLLLTAEDAACALEELLEHLEKSSRNGLGDDAAGNAGEEGDIGWSTRWKTPRTREGFFLHEDQDNCARLYEALMGLNA